ASGDQMVRLWDTRTGQEALTLKGHTNQVLSVSFSPDGQRLASASSDRTVRLWDARAGQELPGQPDFPFRDNPVSPDGWSFALVLGKTSRLIDLRLSDDEDALRRWATRPDPSWHAAEAKRLTEERQPTAAAFHAALAGGLHPGAMAEMRYSVALARSGF